MPSTQSTNNNENVRLCIHSGAFLQKMRKYLLISKLGVININSLELNKNSHQNNANYHRTISGPMDAPKSIILCFNAW